MYDAQKYANMHIGHRQTLAYKYSVQFVSFVQLL